MSFWVWIILAVFAILVLIGIKDGFNALFTSLYENGLKTTIFLVIFFILYLSPSLVKDYAPKYYGLSIWALILYICGFLIYRMFWYNKPKEDEEG
ncbi:hypothetical protein NST63_17905 [Heyndrickxia sp. FSL W8-0496]|uniref:hypothetical protein n=1 Tax=Heyndrickxia sp. FSL W8-0496 TaxID=2954702 RepID=UPI0030FD1ABE